MSADTTSNEDTPNDATPAVEVTSNSTEFPVPVQVSYAEACRVWLEVALLSFGGPTAQIAVMHRILVDERRWISEQRFLHALNYCMLLPGPEAQQLSVYIGWLLHRTKGGLTAGILFILPGAISILALSILYAYFHQTTLLQSIFFGLKSAIVAVVLEAILRISRKALKNRVMVSIAIASFVAMFVFRAPFPLVIMLAGLIGWMGGRISEPHFYVLKPAAGTVSTEHLRPADRNVEDPYYRPSWRRAVRVIVVCLSLWCAPVLICGWTLGFDSVYVQESFFFSKMALVTFGGAYSVLAYMAQQAVEHYHWLTPGEMLDGLGLAESTPGPLIMVVQFVGFLGAWRYPAPLSPFWGGILGSCLATWGTFVPCFMYIFAGAPYIETLRNHKSLSTALSAITAAVVGVIANLAVWLATKTLFRHESQWTWGPFEFTAPVWSSIHLPAVGLTLLACFLTFRLHWNILATLLVCTICGWLLMLSAIT